jgi:hypothetical protein
MSEILDTTNDCFRERCESAALSGPHGVRRSRAHLAQQGVNDMMSTLGPAFDTAAIRLACIGRVDQ